MADLARRLGPKPLIGLPGRRTYGRHVDGFGSIFDDFAMDLYLADYAGEVLAAGGLPIHLPLDADPSDYLPSLHGVLLPGGADIEPGTYGAVPDGNGTYEPERDHLEFALLDGAIDYDLPVLGICRGLQVINVHAGGTLNQHVPEHARYDMPADARAHEVQFEPESRLGLLYGNGGREQIKVNSLHHQTVALLGDDLRVSARDPDGVVEGIERPGQDLLAVQWHPEMFSEPEPVFAWLIQQASKRQRRRG